MAAMWTRIWCVRPVSSVTRRSDRAGGPRGARSASPRREARSVSSDCRVGSRRSRPIAASIRPVRDGGRPRTSARYVRLIRRRRSWAWSRAERHLVARHEEQARRVAVEPMDDPGPAGRATGGPAGERRGQRRPGVPRDGVDEQPRGLHHDQNVVVGVHDLDVLGRQRRLLGLGDRDLDRAPRRPGGPAAAPPVDPHRSGVDQPSGRCARADRRVLRQEPVEPLAAASLGTTSAASGTGIGPRRRRRHGRARLLDPHQRERSRRTPTTMKESARLNVGPVGDVDEVGHVALTHAVGEVRDAPADEEAERDGEDRVARARTGEVHEHPHHGGGREQRHDPEPAREHAEGDARVLDVGDREARGSPSGSRSARSGSR